MGINYYNFIAKSFLSTIAFLLIASISFASTPLNYGDDLTAWINSLGESHTYTFQGTTGDRIFIRARGTSGGVDACIELFDPSGASVAMDCDDGGYVTIDGHELTASGTYTIIGKDHDDNDTGFYGLSLHIVNNSDFTTTIDCQQDMAGTLTHQAEVDAFSYTANAGDVVVMRMRSTAGNIESKIRLYDPSGNILAEASPSGGTSRINPISLPSNGDYTILCYDKNGNDTGDYGFSFQVINPTACAENIECGTFSADLTKIAEMHAYAFQADMGDRIYINMRGSQGVEAELELFDANGLEIASDNPNGGTAEIEDFYINSSGTYFVLARDRKGNDTGSYGFSFQNLGNLTCATEIDCNTNLTASIDALAEMDIYYFEANAGERVMLQMRASSNSLEGELFLYDSNGNLVAEDSPGGGLCEVLDTEIPADGIYFAMINDKHGNDTGLYGFSFQKLDPTCSTVYNCGSGEVTGTFNSLSAIDAYHFTGNAGDIINISMVETGTELEPLLYVYDPDNNRIIDETASHDINVDDFELTQTGTYIALAMDRNGNDMGSYTLNIDCAANTSDSTPPSIAGCSDATFSCAEVNGGGNNSGSPAPTSMNWGGYNMVITFDNSVEVISGTCIFGNMSIVDNGCGGIRTACYGNTLQFTPDWATCGGPFPELPFTIDFGTGLVATFDESGNATIDSYGGSSSGGTVIDEWLTEVTATDDNGSASISNDFDPSGFSCNGGSAGIQVVTFTAIDESNNISTCSATITVTDNTAPNFDNQAAEINDITDGDDLPFQETLTATDACGNATVVKSVGSYEVNSCGDYQITYRWTATDDCGNSSELTKAFDVFFNSDAFSANCPADFTITLGEEGFVQLDASELWGFENGCEFNFFSVDDLYFDCNDAGDHEITFSVMNNNQILTVCDFIITVDVSNCGSGFNNPDYCESYGTANGNKWIQSFTMGEYTNWSGSDNGYGDYTTEIIDLATASSITIELDPKHNNANHQWAIWIDYNQDGTFEDSEKAFSASGKNTLYGTVYIPEDVILGSTRMRVSMKTGWTPEPCSTFQPGEVEDYTINFVSGLNFGGLPSDTPPQSNSQTIQSQPIIKLYPNPTTDYVMVDISKFNNQNGIIQIHNSMGAQVWSSGKQALTDNIYQVDISTLKVPAGVYQLSVIYGKESVTRTIYINNE